MNFIAKTLAGASLALALGVPSAEADVLAFGSFSGEVVVTATEQAVPLRSNGAKVITFGTSKPTTLVAVTYNAVCRAIGDGVEYVSIRIMIDGVEANPRGYAPLCSPPAPGLTSMFAANSRQTAIRVQSPGVHSVSVLAKLVNAESGNLHQASILIQD